MRGIVIRGVAGSVLIAAGGWLFAQIPTHTWVSRVPGLHPVRAAPHHLGLGLALSFVGLALLTWSWWQLRAVVKERRDGVARVRWAAAAWIAPFFLAPPLFSGDGWSYVATGALTGGGWSPYVFTASVLPRALESGVSQRWLYTPSPYGAIPLEWGAAFSHLTQDPWLLLLSYRLFALLGLVVAAWAVPVIARRCGQDAVQASWLAVASPFVLIHGVGGLHNDMVMLALMLAALVVTRRDWWVLGAVLAGAAGAVKAPGVLVAVGVVLLSLAPDARWPVRLRRSVAVGAITLTALFGIGWLSGLGTGWIQALAVPGTDQTPLSIISIIGNSLHSVLRHSGAGGAHLVRVVNPGALVRNVGVALILLLIAWALLWRRNKTTAQAVAAAAVVMLATVLLTPAVRYWYFLWCLPLLACLRLSAPARAALLTGVTVLGIAAVGDPALPVVWLWQTARWMLVLLPALAWLLTRELERRRLQKRAAHAQSDAPDVLAAAEGGGEERVVDVELAV